MIDPNDALFAQWLQMQPPAPDITQEQLPPQTTLQNIIEAFGGFEQQPQATPHSFLQGLIGGVGRGLGSAGTRVAGQRAKLEEGIATRQRARDVANQAATAAFRQAGYRVAEERAKPKAASEQKVIALTPELLQQHPEFKRVPIGTQIPVEWFKPAEAPKPTAGEKVTRDDVKAFSFLNAADIGQDWSSPTIKRRAAGQRPVAGKPPTEYQAKAGAFASRAQAAIESVFPKGHTATAIETRIATLSPYDQIAMRGPNVLQSPDMKAYNQAKYAFALALNRQESGANISPAEFDKVDKAFFVQPGDGLAEAKRKQKARQLAIDELRTQAITPTVTPENDPEYQTYLRASGGQ